MIRLKTINDIALLSISRLTEGLCYIGLSMLSQCMQTHIFRLKFEGENYIDDGQCYIPKINTRF